MIDVKTGGQDADHVIREIGAEFGQRFGRFYEMVGPRVFRPFPARDADDIATLESHGCGPQSS